ncbi:methyltransferase [Streptomyces sp. NPDC059224]|uniref:methyltransferase n=1 Tax=Streptomyces sp. NPDC059224 TaxID=3346775 RepID=UPI003683E22E
MRRAPEALDAARARLAGLTARCTFLAGDFTESVPEGGDVCLRSRVLHDWHDERCRTILARCPGPSARTPNSPL